MSSTKHLTPLVDGDILVYRCGFAADSERKRWYKENVAEDAAAEDLDLFLYNEDYLSIALGNVKTALSALDEHFDLSKLRLFITGKGNYRESVATILPYKGNRDALHKPKYYEDIRQYMINVWGAEVVDGQEADDMLGSLQYAATDDSTVIVSIDKDLDMIPGNHYNPVTKTFYYVGQEEADLNFFKQMLVGDRTDNIPGIKNIGEVKSSRLIEQCNYDVDRMREEVKRLYQAQYGADWEGAYQEIATLLWIRRDMSTPPGEVPLI